jgi:hypothetical protein
LRGLSHSNTITRGRATLIACVAIAVVVLGVFYVVLARQQSPSTLTLTSSTTHQVLAGNQTYPGFFSLALPNLIQGNTWKVGVAATGGSVGVNFCVLSDGSYQTWANSYYVTSNPGLSFPWNQCLVSSGQTLQTTLVFTVPSSGGWDIVAINNNPNVVTVTCSPAR